LPEVLTAGADHTIKKFNERGVQSRAIGAMGERIEQIISFVVGGETLLASAAADGKIAVWNLRQHRLLLSQEAHTGGVHCLAVSPKGDRLATWGQDHTLRLWQRANGKRLADISTPTRELLALYLLSTGQTLVGVTKEAILRWKVEESVGKLHLRPEAPTPLSVGKITTTALSADGKRLALGTEEAFVALWNLETQRVERKIEASEFPITAVAWSRDGAWIAAGDERGNLRLWGAQDGKPRRFLSRTFAKLRRVVFSSDGNIFITGSEDGTLHYWDAFKGLVKARTTAHTGAVLSLVVSP
jgi:WD40 repeat protein